ncbi:hypothetical protein TNCV_775341 [Trichonephila clavipes]|nr:hypothetical protein TNCV_775341 [Trichonephila clavipes]
MRSRVKRTSCLRTGSAACKRFQILVTDRPLHVIRDVFAEEVFRSQWGAYALWKSARTLEHSCCQCTHKNDGG